MKKHTLSWTFLLLLIVAGEAVFILPFVLARIFRPTVLSVFQIDNTELGTCFSLYGIVALVSYLLGGPIADRFSPRKLMALALWLTALGGILFSTFPSLHTLQLLYAYWGFTTIFLFWSPLIKATRMWGGASAQGKAFGFFDGGRGLVAALIGAIGVTIYSLFSGSVHANTSLHENRDAFRWVILASTLFIFIIGVFVWFFLRLPSEQESDSKLSRIKISEIQKTLGYYSVWLLMIILLCAYVGYKITDVFSLYAQDVLAMNQVDAAKVGSALLFMRPVVGVLLGLTVDRFRKEYILFASFIVSLFGAMLFIFQDNILVSNLLFFVLSTMLIVLGVYSVRCLSYAVMEKGAIPLRLTGTAVGLISVVGYTPDIFVGPSLGYFLDHFPPSESYRSIFLLFGCFCVVGGLASYLFVKRYASNK